MCFQVFLHNENGNGRWLLHKLTTEIISSSEYQSTYENCSVLLWWTKGASSVSPFAHIIFLQAFAIHLEAIFFQQIISVIIMIAIYSVALNEELSVYHDNSVTSGLDGTGVFMADCLGQFYDISWWENYPHILFLHLARGKLFRPTNWSFDPSLMTRSGS